jgi:hypothetical protein
MFKPVLTSSKYLAPLALTVAMVPWALALAAVPPQSQSPTPDPTRAAVMQHHFAAIARVHEAVIRGDLAGARARGSELGSMATPTGLGSQAEEFVSRIRQAARLAGTAPDLREAAASTVTMLQQCGDCHRSVGTYPAPKPIARPDVGGIVGHMLAHLDAADDLLEGLVVPSDTKWRSGAEKLQRAALHANAFPRDPGLTRDVRAAEMAVHALAERAREATTSRTRGVVYADLLTTCATCHSLHPRVWGPTTR